MKKLKLTWTKAIAIITTPFMIYAVIWILNEMIQNPKIF